MKRTYTYVRKYSTYPRSNNERTIATQILRVRLCATLLHQRCHHTTPNRHWFNRLVVQKPHQLLDIVPQLMGLVVIGIVSNRLVLLIDVVMRQFHVDHCLFDLDVDKDDCMEMTCGMHTNLGRGRSWGVSFAKRSLSVYSLFASARCWFTGW
jgi:hypothetical protein